MHIPQPLIILLGFSLVMFIVIASSCKTYLLPVDSFKEQMASQQAKNTKQVKTMDPWGGSNKYQTFGLTTINVVDKNGQIITLPVSPALEIRFTNTSGHKTTFYLDLVRFNGDTIDGGRSRIIPSLRKKIPIETVRKIEVQDGRKKYSYAKQ